jgi:hypothetical protein
LERKIIVTYFLYYLCTYGHQPETRNKKPDTSNMNEVFTLLKPRIWPLRHRGFSNNNRGGAFKIFLFGVIGALFWGGIFAISLRVLHYFRGIEDIGDILGAAF